MSKRFVYPAIAANQELFVATSGRFIRCLKASGGNGEIFIRFPKQEGMASEFEIPIYPGTWFQLPANERFTELFLRCPQALTDVELVVADGIYGDDRLSLTGGALLTTPLGGALNEIADGAVPVAVGAGLCVSVAPATNSRQNLIVRNTGGEAIYLRSNNTAQESAFEVGANQTVFLEVINELFAYNPGGVSVNVQVSEIV